MEIVLSCIAIMWKTDGELMKSVRIRLLVQTPAIGYNQGGIVKAGTGWAACIERWAPDLEICYNPVAVIGYKMRRHRRLTSR